MEARCAVETWGEFGCTGESYTLKIKASFETCVLLCTGSDRVYLFNPQEKKLKVVLQFPGPVCDLVQSHDGQLLYVACSVGVYCVSMQFLLSRASESSSPAELQISSEFLVVADEEVLSLLLVGCVLVTFSQKDRSWVLTLYNSPNQSAPSSLEVLGSFSLPLVSVVVQSDTEGESGVKRRPVLSCVHSSDATPSSSSTSSSGTLPAKDHLNLEPVLFKLLFGVDVALAKSPVILFGLPDGRLCFLPLRLPGSRLRVLHSLEQPVVFLGASVVTETSPVHAGCLVALGELGKLVLMRADRGGPEGEGHGKTVGFLESCVPGPVTCGCTDKNSLYYSTGSDLLVLDLSEMASEGEAHSGACNKAGSPLQSPTSLNVCRVMALAETTCSGAGNAQMLALSVRGQLQRITLPVQGQDARSDKVLSTQVGRSVRDVLSAIGDVCERALVLKAAIKSKNQTLKSLNHVQNISILLMAAKNSEDPSSIQEKPIRCRAVTCWSKMLQKDSLTLTCVLDNSSAYVFEQGWTLSLAVCQLSYSPSEGGENSCTHFSFPFHDLHPGQTLEVSLPVAAADEMSFPVTVHCSLIFSLQSLLGEDTDCVQNNNISLPLNTLTVDWLHALQVDSPTAAHRTPSSHSDNTRGSVLAFLNSSRISCGGRGEGVESALKPERDYSASVRVSSELLRHTLELERSGLDPQEPHHSVCVSLMQWLLSGGPGGLKTATQGGKPAPSSSVVNAHTPNGHRVKLTAKEVNAGDEGSEGTVEVQVKSSCIAAVCGLHHAVLRRIQTLLLKAPERSTKTVHSLGLRQALQQADHLLQQIRQSRISEGFGVGVSAGKMNQSLLSFYLELRKNPLLIM